MARTVGSLFSGIGGIELGFAQAGFEIAWAVEKDPACCRTYRYNFPAIKLLERDIRTVSPSDLSPVDILTAGFPCQPFSIAGKQKGFSDARGQLFYEVGRFMEAHRPRFVFLENVPNLLDHNNGKTLNAVHNLLSELDYSIRYRVLRASKFGGVPQIRDRIYIVAFREQSDCDCFSYPEPIALSCSIEEILQRQQIQHPIYYYNCDDPFYAYAKPIVTQKDSIYRVYHESIKITQNHMCPTLTASMGTRDNQVPLIVDQHGLRKLTLRECLDFQGFPMDYYFPNTITINDAYRQIGNSVCVPVVRRIAEQISGIF